eukprot:47708-Pyramimonas_sp.AAC.1
MDTMGIQMNDTRSEAQTKTIDTMLDQKVVDIKRAMPPASSPSSTASFLSGSTRAKPEAMSDPRKVWIGEFPRPLFGRVLEHHGHTVPANIPEAARKG